MYLVNFLKLKAHWGQGHSTGLLDPLPLWDWAKNFDCHKLQHMYLSNF